MSDRIFVLNDGRIEQRGTPDELYTEPRNVFVASFIGNPSMNFLDGTVAAVDDHTIELLVDGHAFAFDADIIGDVAEGDDIILGFRPETVDVFTGETEGDLAGQLSLVERIGDRVLATIDRDTGEVRATVDADHDLQEDTAVSFSFERSGVHIFDAETEEVVARGSKPVVNA